MQGRGMVSRSLIWTVFSSRMRLPASQASRTFWAIWSSGPAAGPTGLEAARPWKRTDRSRSGEPRQNFRAGRSNILASPRDSAKTRRRRLGNGAGISSAKAPSVDRRRVVQPYGAHHVVHVHDLAPALRRVARVGDEQRGLVVGD